MVTPALGGEVRAGSPGAAGRPSGRAPRTAGCQGRAPLAPIGCWIRVVGVSGG